jgi:hypothetical protein
MRQTILMLATVLSLVPRGVGAQVRWDNPASWPNQRLWSDSAAWTPLGRWSVRTSYGPADSIAVSFQRVTVPVYAVRIAHRHARRTATAQYETTYETVLVNCHSDRMKIAGEDYYHRDTLVGPGVLGGSVIEPLGLSGDPHYSLYRKVCGR